MNVKIIRARILELVIIHKGPTRALVLCKGKAKIVKSMLMNVVTTHVRILARALIQMARIIARVIPNGEVKTVQKLGVPIIPVKTQPRA